MTHEFMAAMHDNPKIAQGSKLGRRKLHVQEKQRKLRENLMKKARKLTWNQAVTQEQIQTAANSNQYGWGNQYQEKDYQYGGQYHYNDVSYNGGSYKNGQWNGQGMNGKYLNNQGYDNFADGADGTWAGNWASEYNADFDMTSKSFKYAGCASIKNYDEQFAMDSETNDPFKTQTYVTFRLCPAENCNKYSLMGCSRNYGEYVVEMESYLESIIEYYSQRYEEYCEYCLTCDSEVQLEASEMLEQCYFEKTMEELNQNSNANQATYSSGNNNNNKNKNYDSVYNNGNGLQSNYYQSSSGGNRRLAYNYNANTDDEFDDDDQGEYGQSNTDGYYSKQMYDGNGYWVNGQFMEGYWKNGLFYQYDENIMATINNCKKGQYEGNYQDYDCSNLNDCDEQNQMDYPPCDNDVCGDYYTYCSELEGNVKNQTSSDNTNFMTCTPFESFSFVQEETDDEDQEQQNKKYKRYAYYEEGEGIVFYIGPHCAGDHYHLTLGVFSDEYCENYIGDQVSVSQVLGFQFDSSNIFQLPEECLSCDGMADVMEYNEYNYEHQGESRYNDDYYSSKQQGYYKVQNGDDTATYQYNPNYRYKYDYDPDEEYNPNSYYLDENGDPYDDDVSRQRVYGANGNYYSTYVNAPDTDDDGVVAMCSTLYSASAQCNRNLNSYKTYSQFMTNYELQLEKKYCTFIDNIVYGTYNSKGDIILGGGPFDLSSWRSRQNYGR
eukprot:scaffold22610_cov115-Cylindrotheca_fusiformis.AAC.1